MSSAHPPQRGPVPIAVLASGRGSNFDAIAKAVDEGRLNARISAVLSDHPQAAVLAKARAAGIPAVVVPLPPPGPERRKVHDESVLAALEPHAPRWLVMAGYMRMVSPRLIEAFRTERGYARIVNIHPSLLPAFPGVGSYAKAFRHGAKVAGVTIHLVEEEMDSGPICAQESFPIAQCRSEEEVERLGLAIEHRLYAETLEWLLREEFTVEKREGRLCVRPN